MTSAFFRVILYVHDVEALSAFYRDTLGFSVRDHIAGEWVALGAGGCELGLHRVGPAFRGKGPRGGVESNVKLVFLVDRALEELRAELTARGLVVGEIRRYAGQPGPHFDGRDPEGNVFQIVRSDTP